jgi:LysR family glycine cleavage system transcriptional activator
MAGITHLGSLQALELAIRTGSLKAAAAALNITPAAVGQRIKLIEDYLGVDLLVRGRSGIRPTRELETALEHLSIAFRELDAAASLLDFQRVHELQIVGDTDWSELWLKPRLPGFREHNPNIHFCINGVGDVPVRLGQADCEIWFGPPRGTGAEYELFHDYLVPMATPVLADYLGRMPDAAMLEGVLLLHLDCYAGDPDALGWPEWIARFGQRTTGLGRGIHYRNITSALETVYADAGFMVCGLALASRLCAEGRLNLFFPVAQGAWTSHAYRVRFRESALRRAQTARFRDWLLAEAAATDTALRQQLAAG